MYRPSEDTELTGAQMERARSVFIGWLWKRNLSADFIHNHADDLLGEAHGEYVKAVKHGGEIEDPVGWTVFCAWRRLNRRLERGPEVHEVVSEKLPELADLDGKTPEGEAEARDRASKIQDAVRQLRRDQQRIIALTYFEGQTLRDAAEALGWGYGTAHRRYKSAVEKLEKHFKAMGIESSDDLVVEIGVASSIAATGAGPSLHIQVIEIAADKAEHLVGGAWEKASHLTAGAWTRVHDLSRRFNLGGNGDAAGVVASSGAGRTAGVCATAVVACVVGASGVVGPGIEGGIGLFAGHDNHGQARADTKPAPLTASRAATTAQVRDPAQSSTSTAESTRSHSDTPATGSESHAPAYGAGSASDLRVRDSGLQNHIEEEESGSSSPEASSSQAEASTSSASASSTVSEPSASGSSSTSRTQASQQFGTIR